MLHETHARCAVASRPKGPANAGVLGAFSSRHIVGTKTPHYSIHLPVTLHLIIFFFLFVFFSFFFFFFPFPFSLVLGRFFFFFSSFPCMLPSQRRGQKRPGCAC